VSGVFPAPRESGQRGAKIGMALTAETVTGGGKRSIVTAVRRC
jgi:hypothetical protein